MIDKAVTILTMLRPPRMSDNGGLSLAERTQLYEARVKRWRWTVFYALLAIILVQVTDVTLSWGLVPRLHAGFQVRDEAEAIAHGWNVRTARIELRLLEQDLLTTRVGQCEARDKSYFTDRLRELRREYHRMVGQPWDIPLCREVGAKEVEADP